ncbi:Forkhead box protein like [Actinidia chinensis var. chinensis]|uniref:Forkhead box protein like n=1 Tax=Actinidia chinensis var. chinensis TaxID=1590841 RepID=A0A2R6RYW6_ACTCC|nr:Forkhead box protein like [Actinidia chinensis var. chinensis]
MAGKPNHIFSLLVVFLCLGMLFTSIHARPIHTAPNHRHHHKMSSRPRQGGKNYIGHGYDEVLALRGIKNSGPSPGEGHSVVNGVHN